MRSLRGEVVHRVRPTHTLALSRAVSSMAPTSGARTPEVEAGIVLASLMHDVAYSVSAVQPDSKPTGKRAAHTTYPACEAYVARGPKALSTVTSFHALARRGCQSSWSSTGIRSGLAG